MAVFRTDDFVLVDFTNQTKAMNFGCANLTAGSLKTLIVPAFGAGSTLDSVTIGILEGQQNWTGGNTFWNTLDSQAVQVRRFGAGYTGYILSTLDHATAPMPFRISYHGSVVDVAALFCNRTDESKRLSLELANLATATTRTWTAPDASIVVAGSAAALTSGRVPFATAGGLLLDDADMTFATDTLTVTKLVAPTSVAVGGGSAITALAAGVYTPIRSAEVNITGTVTPTQAQYQRVGSVVTVSGRFTVDPTLTLTATSFEMTLPVASNIGAVEDLAGIAGIGNTVNENAEIIGSIANNTAVVQWVAADVASRTWSYVFTYRVV